MMRIGIAIGDVTGVGPEVALKAVAAESRNDDAKYIFIGDENILQPLNEKLALALPLKQMSEGDGKFFVTNPFPKKLPQKLMAGSPIAAKAAMAALGDGAEQCLRGELDAMVTAPVQKSILLDAGFAFTGHTEYLAARTRAALPVMLLLTSVAVTLWLPAVTSVTAVVKVCMPLSAAVNV